MLDNNKRINSKKQLNEWLDTELSAYKCSKIARAFWISEFAVLYHFQRRLRLCEYYKNTNKSIRYIFSKLLLSKMQNKYSLHIPENCIGKGLKIMHLGPILINGNATIGENFSIHINTAIVAGGRNSNVPVLGDGIVVGVGAVILGEVQLADNIAIGANAVVNKSFDEPNIAIAGVPAKKISNNGRLEWNKH